MHLEKAKNKTQSTTEWACLSCSRLNALTEVILSPFLKKMYFIFWLHCIACGILIPNQGWKLHPLHWKHGVLTAAPPVKPLAVAVKRHLAILTDVHSGLAPEQQLQTLWFTVHTTVVQGRVPQGRLLIQVPTEQ